MSSTVEHYLSEFQNNETALPGQQTNWLKTYRNDAINRFSDLKFPGIKNESWKYTRTAPIEKHHYAVTTQSCIQLMRDDIETNLISDCYDIVFVNGLYTPQLSTKTHPSTFSIQNIASVLSESPDQLATVLTQKTVLQNNVFNALNAAFMIDGAYIQIEDNAIIDKPIQIVYIATQQSNPVFCQPRNIILAGKNSQATIIENYASMGESNHFTNAVSEIKLAENAQLEHCKIQLECQKSYHIAQIHSHQKRGSHFKSHSFALGGLITRNEITTLMTEPGCECTLNGLYIGKGRQHIDHQTDIQHLQPHCTSNERYKGILDDRSRAVFSGKVQVHPDAQKTISMQSNANILLSKHAEIDTKPMLEIYADDVKCAHGATVGQLNEDEIFFLQARGIDLTNARTLLTYAFAAEMVGQISNHNIADYLTSKLQDHLPNGNAIKELA